MTSLLLLSGVLAAGVILGLSIAWFRVQVWKRRADHWLTFANALEAELISLKFGAFLADRGIEWPKAQVTHSPASPATLDELIAPSSFSTGGDND